MGRSVTPLRSLLQTACHQLKFQERRLDLNQDNRRPDAHACAGTVGRFQVIFGDTDDQMLRLRHRRIQEVMKPRHRTKNETTTCKM